MANSTSSKASRTTDKTGSGQKGTNRARVQQVVHGVKKGRVKKHRRGGAVTKRVREVSEQEESNSEIPAGETNDTDEDDAYDYAGTDGSCSEESGSATEKDTPTRIALERRQESRKEIRSKITSRPLARPKDPVRPSQLTPTTPSTTKQNQRQFLRGTTLRPVGVTRAN